MATNANGITNDHDGFDANDDYLVNGSFDDGGGRDSTCNNSYAAAMLQGRQRPSGPRPRPNVLRPKTLTLRVSELTTRRTTSPLTPRTGLLNASISQIQLMDR